METHNSASILVENLGYIFRRENYSTVVTSCGIFIKLQCSIQRKCMSIVKIISQLFMCFVSVKPIILVLSTLM